MLSKSYEPKDHEEKIYQMWETSGYFNPDKLPGERKETFSMVLPPPNVTGTLHTGHAIMVAVEDIMVRYNRMRGKKTLWVPGTDHAAIATQSKVESELFKREKKTKHDIGREDFLLRVETFAKESHDTIVGQIKKMGASVDWSREAYTLDKEREMAVRTAFVKMYEDEIIYRGNRIVNWDPILQTNVSDDEIERVEKKSKFYFLKYGPFVIGTARPETKFGDKYVVMHPDDKRYAKYEHGQTLGLEWINGPITATVIKDGAVDMEFGTGVMTITPWHDVTDFEIAERHNLDKEQIIDLDGKLLSIAGEFAGQHIKKAREKIVQKLAGKGLIDHIDEDYTNNIATNSRGGGVIEPQIREQWFVNVEKGFGPKKNTLKKIMQSAVKDGKIKILPERFEKVYFHWIDNLRDWNISRQLWFGHQVPVWYKDKETHVGVEPPKDEGWEQDPDTLDTWFSSGLWTFSTLGWPFDWAQSKPKKGSDLEQFHPTDVLETGYDILFFWVARMILFSEYLLGDIPFKTVYLHGLVRDEKGRKMSKSLGNIVDPLDLIDKFGTDALRMAMIVGVGAGSDVVLGEEKIKAYKHFANKLWNIARFVLENTKDVDMNAEYSKEDKIVRKRFNELTLKKVTKNIDIYRLNLAAEILYQYIWHEFADIIIEHSKTIFIEGTAEEKLSRKKLLLSIFVDSIKVLHPFMPYVTEAIWQQLPKKETDLLIIASWPTN